MTAEFFIWPHIVIQYRSEAKPEAKNIYKTRPVTFDRSCRRVVFVQMAHKKGEKIERVLSTLNKVKISCDTWKEIMLPITCINSENEWVDSP